MGNASLKSPKTALLIIDMINTLDFPEGPQLRRQALPVTRRIAALKEKFSRLKLPVIYVNDNFGEWGAEWKAVFEKCSHPDSRGSEIAQILKPGPKDYFILKPRHSGFHQTPLEILLEELKIKRLIITGMAGNICVLFTAHDAHMRGFEVIVPQDCIASNIKRQNHLALVQLSQGLKIDILKSNQM